MMLIIGLWAWAPRAGPPRPGPTVLSHFGHCMPVPLSPWCWPFLFLVCLETRLIHPTASSYICSYVLLESQVIHLLAPYLHLIDWEHEGVMTFPQHWVAAIPLALQLVPWRGDIIAKQGSSSGCNYLIDWIHESFRSIGIAGISSAQFLWDLWTTSKGTHLVT